MTKLKPDSGSEYDRNQILACKESIRSVIELRSKGLPWAANMKMHLEGTPTGYELTLQFKTPFFMFLSAESFLKAINHIAADSVQQLEKVILKTSPLEFGDFIYNPEIIWKVNANDRRKKNLHREVLPDFYRFLWSKLYYYGVEGNPTARKQELLNWVFENEEPQLQAIYRLICHFVKQGYMDGSKPIYLGDLLLKDNHDLVRGRNSGHLTRLSALNVAHMIGMIDLFSKQQVRIWPPQESARHTEVLKMIELLLGFEAGSLVSESRKAEIVYGRHLAIHILDTVTSNSLETLAGHVGRKDHTTALNAIKRIDDYSVEWDFHGVMVDMLCELMDTTGIYREECRRLNADRGYRVSETSEGLFLGIHDEEVENSDDE